MMPIPFYPSSKRALGIGLLLLYAWSSSYAGTATGLEGLYYTGVDNGGGLLAGGTNDSHWSVSYAYANGIADNPAYQGPAYVVSSAYAYPGWIPNTSTAQWITAPGALTAPTGGTADAGGAYLPGNGTSGPNRGNYIYTLAFNISGTGSGTVTNKVSIALTLAADNQAKVYVNPSLNPDGSIAGGLVGGTFLDAWDNTSTLTLRNYGVSRNASFVIGTNTLVIQVDNTLSMTGTVGTNTLNPSGLLVYQTGTAILIDGKPVVPEVGVWLPIAGALGLFLWQRRRQSEKPLLSA